MKNRCAISGQFDAPIEFKRLSPCSGEEVIVNLDFEPFLLDAGLRTFTDFWNLCGETVKDIGTRSVQRTLIKARQNQISSPVWYIKKHREPSASHRKLFPFQHNIKQGEGVREFIHCCKFRQNGLATVIPIAAGNRFSSTEEIESFLITQDFAPSLDLETLILEHPERIAGERNRQKRLDILSSVAAYARKMHEAGLNHEDFNATHILLLNLEGTGMPQVAVFDLQRVDQKAFKRLYWPIKALAELNYTLPDEIFGNQERLFLFSQYKGKKRLSPLDKLQLKLIEIKTGRIARHSEKRNLAPKYTRRNSF